MEIDQLEQIKRLLEQNNAMTKELLLMEKELFDARKKNLEQGNEHIQVAGKLARGALKIQPVALLALLVVLGLLLYMVIFKI